MATVNKDFRVKNGLIVEGSTGTINGSNILTEASTTFLNNYVKDAAGGLLADATLSNIQISYNPTTNALSIAAENGVADSTTNDLVEGTGPNANLYFTSERAQDAAAALLTTGSHNGIEFSYDDTNNVIVATVTGAAVPTFSTGIVFEGGQPDNFETTLSVTEPTQDNTITLKNASGTIAFETDITNAINALDTDDIEEGTTNKYFTDERAQDAAAALFAAGTHTNITVTYDDNAGSLSLNATGGVASLSGTANEVEVTNVGTAYTVGLPNDVTIAGNLTLSTEGTQASHAVTKSYVDAAVEGLHIHASAVAATTTNINLATDLENGDVLDGVTLATGNRVLVKNQTNPAQNGIYVVQASGAAVRATDFDSPAEVDGGDFIFVTGGTVNDNTGWVQVSTGIVTIGTDPIVFTQFSGAGTYLAGNGLTLTGNTFAIDTGTTVDLNTTQTLTNKTLTAPKVSGLYLSDNNVVIEGTDDTHETTLNFTDPTQDNTITFKNATGTVAFTSDITSAVDALTTSDIEEGTNKYFTDERAQDAIASAIAAGTHSNITITYDDTNNKFTFAAENGVADSTTNNLVEGTDNSVNGGNNLYFTNARAVAALEAVVPNFTEIDINSLATQVAATSSGSAAVATVAYQFAKADYRSAKFLVKVAYGSHTEVSEVLLTLDTSDNIAITEYAVVGTNGSASAISADISGSNVRLLVTPTNNGSTIRVFGTLLA